MTAIASKSPVTQQQGSRVLTWAGRLVSALPVIVLGASAAAKLTQQPKLVEALTTHLGFQAGTITTIAVVEILVTLLYVVPQTVFLGAALVTAYLGGIVATHLRVGDPVAMPIVLGVLVWLGLYLRDERLRALTPFRAS